jgi:hypothetical protein
MMNEIKASCSSPAAMFYWFIVSLIAWGVLGVVLGIIGVYSHPFRVSASAACLIAMAIGCAANWFRNHSFHCAITGPVFLIAGIVFLLADTRVIHGSVLLVWPFVLIAVGIAFLLEWRYANRPAC